MVNTKHDTTSYESCGYKREIFNINALYDAYKRSKRNSDWKPQVQRYEMNFLLELTKLCRELKERTFKFLPSIEFVLRERGKVRVITGEQIHDRIAKGCLCNESLLPSIRKYLIYDNGASLKGKGIDFTRRRIDTHLRKYYQQNKSNEGYILLIDFKKYYDNIRHDHFINIFKDVSITDGALWLMKKTIEKARVDVSYLTDVEYERCMDAVFNSLEYQQISKDKLTGEKFMDKHMNIGDVVAQVAGIAYPIKFDNYIKIVKGIKYYGRYMDDSYIIHSDKDYLKKLLSELIEVADSIGITVNTNKTRICKLSSYWRFLQIQYSLTDTGRIVRKINSKRLTAMRRKLKKLSLVLSEREFENFYKSWIGNHYKIMSKRQRDNMNKLYSKLRRNDLCIK
jgi:hypothetical protein